VVVVLLLSIYTWIRVCLSMYVCTNCTGMLLFSVMQVSVFAFAFQMLT